MKHGLIPIKKRILAFATDGEIEAKLRQILARRWGGKDFPKLTEIVYRLYMQWGRNGSGGIFKQGVLSARVVKIIDEAIAESCRSLGIANWEAKNVVRKLDKEINMAFKRGVTDARLDLKKMGISMALERRNEMLFDLNRAYREFNRNLSFDLDAYHNQPAPVQKAAYEAFQKGVAGKARGGVGGLIKQRLENLVSKSVQEFEESLKTGKMYRAPRFNEFYKAATGGLGREYFPGNRPNTSDAVWTEAKRKTVLKKLSDEELASILNGVWQIYTKKLMEYEIEGYMYEMADQFKLIRSKYGK